jgi:hypothetical protein
MSIYNIPIEGSGWEIVHHFRVKTGKSWRDAGCHSILAKEGHDCLMDGFIPSFMKVGITDQVDALRGFRPHLIAAARKPAFPPSSYVLNCLSFTLYLPLIGVLMAVTAAVLHDRTNSGSPKLQPNKTIRPAHPPHSSSSFVTFQSLFR